MISNAKLRIVVKGTKALFGNLEGRTLKTRKDEVKRMNGFERKGLWWVYFVLGFQRRREAGLWR